jgi:hypothetical protein
MPIPNDLGFYLWTLLKANEETSLFPELFEVMHPHGRGEAIRSIASHPWLSVAVRASAKESRISEDKLRRAVVAVAVKLHEFDRPRQFVMLFDFVEVFGGTRLDVPSRDKFFAVTRDASLYWAYLQSERSDDAVAEIAKTYRIKPERVLVIVERVERVVARFGEVGV